jgi:hypothetical protein
VDTQTGKLYGHVVADDPLTGLAYIIPAKSVFDDIRRRLGKEVRLPVDNVDTGHVILQAKLADRQCHAEKMSTVSSAATPSPNTEHISETFDQGVKCSDLVLNRVIGTCSSSSTSIVADMVEGTGIFGLHAVSQSLWLICVLVSIVTIFFTFSVLGLPVRQSVTVLQTETIVVQLVNPRTEATAALRGERANVSST